MRAIRQAVLHRECGNAHNYFDYIHFLRSSKNKSTEEFYKRRNKALLKLVEHIIDNELTDKQKEVFLLHINQGLNNKQIASLLGVNASTISRSLASSFKIFDKAYKHFECMYDMFVD